MCKQVHALEQAFGAKLLEPHARGCRLTDDGELLLALAAPSVASFDALWRGFDEARAKRDVWLTVAATKRILNEDLAGPLRGRGLVLVLQRRDGRASLLMRF